MKSIRLSVRYITLFSILFLVSACAGQNSYDYSPASTATIRPTLPITPTFIPTATPTIAPTPTIIPISGASADNVIPLMKYDVGVVVGSAFSPDERIFAVGRDDGTIILWDSNTNKQISTLSGHTGSVYSITFSQDATKLVSGDEKGVIIVWDVFSGEQIHRLKADSPYHIIAISPDGKTLISIDNLHIIIWNVATGERIRTLICPEFCGAVAFSPDGKFFAVSTSTKSLKTSIALRDSTTGEKVLDFDGEHVERVFSISFSPDGKILASGDRWDFIKIWDAESGKLLSTFNSRYNDPTGGGPSEFTRGIDVGRGVDGLAFSPDGKILASGHNEGPIVLWDISTTQPIHVLRDDNYKLYFARHLTSLSFSADGSILKSGRQNSLIIFWGINENLTRYSSPLFP